MQFFSQPLTFITMKEAGLNWDSSNEMKDYGYIDGYSRGYNFEFKHKDTGEIKFGSARFVEGSLIQDLNECLSTKYEGTPFYLESCNGYYPTGRAIFRGYYTSHWDPVERDEYVEEASHEVKELLERFNPKQTVLWDESFDFNMDSPKSIFQLQGLI